MMDYSQYAPQPNELRSQPARSLVLRLFNDLTGLLDQEYQLMKTELSQKRGPLVRAGNSLGLALAFGFIALVCLSIAAVTALGLILSLPLAACIVGVVCAAIAYVSLNRLTKTLATDGSFRLERTSKLIPTHKATTKTLDEQETDIAWTRKRIDETLSALERKNDIGQPLRDTAAGMGALGVALANIVREEKKTLR